MSTLKTKQTAKRLGKHSKSLSFLACGALLAQASAGCVARQSDGLKPTAGSVLKSERDGSKSLLSNIELFVQEGLVRDDAKKVQLQKQLLGLYEFLKTKDKSAKQLTRKCAYASAACGLMWANLTLPLKAAAMPVSGSLANIDWGAKKELIQAKWDVLTDVVSPELEELKAKVDAATQATLEQLGKQSDLAFNKLSAETVKVINRETVKNLVQHIPSEKLTNMPDYSEFAKAASDVLLYNFKAADAHPDLSDQLLARTVASGYPENALIEIPVTKANFPSAAVSADGKFTVGRSQVLAGALEFRKADTKVASIETLSLKGDTIAFLLVDGNGKYTDVLVAQDFDAFNRPTKFFGHKLFSVGTASLGHEIAIDGEVLDANVTAVGGAYTIEVKYDNEATLKNTLQNTGSGQVQRLKATVELVVKRGVQTTGDVTGMLLENPAAKTLDGYVHVNGVAPKLKEAISAVERAHVDSDSAKATVLSYKLLTLISELTPY